MRIYPLTAALAIIFLFIFGCSSSQVDPVQPLESGVRVSEATHSIWGMWQFIADPDAETLDIVSLRSTDFHLNALPFLEPPPMLNLTLETLEFNGNVIDADIGLRHPFLGLTEFTGFDVCGLLISNGSVSGFSSPALLTSGDGDTRLMNPDGASRWWNPAEFPNDGTIFGYTDGLLGEPDSAADFNGTLSGYKFFCDDFVLPTSPMSDLDPTSRCVFSAGQKNIRHYTIELGSEGMVFNYAVDASWQFPEGSPPYQAPDDFGPGANRSEAWNADVTEVLNTLWNDGVDSGGELKLSIDLWDHYNAELNTVYIESPGNFAPVGPFFPTGGGAGFSTYEVDIINATPSIDAIDIYIMAECEITGYGSSLPGETLTAYFIHTANVGTEPQAEPADPITGNVELKVLRDSSYAITDVQLNWTGNGSPEYAIYADINPYDTVDVDTYVAATSAETIDIDTSNYADFSTTGSYVFTVRARSVVGSSQSESTDSQYAFVDMEDFDGGTDPSGGWQSNYMNADTEFVIEAGPIDGDVLRLGPTPAARWTTQLTPGTLPALADTEYSVFEVAQSTVYWESKPWSEQIDGMYSQTTVGWADGVPTNGANKCLELHTPPLDAAIDGTWDLEDQLNPTSWLIALGNYFSGGPGLWHGWRVFFLDRDASLPTRFTRATIPEYRTETDVYAAYGFAVYPGHVCPDEFYADEFAIIIY